MLTHTSPLRQNLRPGPAPEQGREIAHTRGIDERVEHQKIQCFSKWLRHTGWTGMAAGATFDTFFRLNERPVGNLCLPCTTTLKIITKLPRGLDPRRD